MKPLKQRSTTTSISFESPILANSLNSALISTARSQHAVKDVFGNNVFHMQLFAYSYSGNPYNFRLKFERECTLIGGVFIAVGSHRDTVVARCDGQRKSNPSSTSDMKGREASLAGTLDAASHSDLANVASKLPSALWDLVNIVNWLHIDRIGNSYLWNP